MNQWNCNVFSIFRRFLKWNLILAMIIAVIAISGAMAFAQDNSQTWLSAGDLQKVTHWIAQDVSNSRQSYCYRDSYGRGAGRPMKCATGEQEDAGLCYTPCPAGFKGVGPVCWKYCPDGYKDDGATCRKDVHIFAKDSYGRGVGKAQSINASWQLYCNIDVPEKDGGLCYKRCNSGYTGVGPVCWRFCPVGYTDDGATCRKDAHIFGKESKPRGVGKPLSTCSSGEEKDGALCYPTCRSGFYGVGPVCWQNCPTGRTNCGAGCTTGTTSCVEDTANMITAPVILAVNIFTMGSASGATSAASAASKLARVTAAVKRIAAATKDIREAIRLAKQVGTVVYESSQTITLWLNDYVGSFQSMTNQNVVTELSKQFGSNPRALLWIKQQYALNHLTLMVQSDLDETSKNVLGAVAVFDPTGVAGVVDAFLKPVCVPDKSFPTVRLLTQSVPPAVPVAPAGPTGYTRCAGENGTCSFSGTRTIAYGANGRFAYKTATNSINCNNGVFGDPIPNTVKACYVGPAAPVGPTGYTWCAGENGRCSFSGTKSVAYGANGRFAYRTATNGMNCTNGIFGDPIPGTVKACYMR